MGKIRGAISAIFHLGIRFNIHLFQRIAGIFKSRSDQADEFEKTYHEDRISGYTFNDLKRLPEFERCVSCGLCEDHCELVKTGSLPEFPGPREYVTAYGRSVPESRSTTDRLYMCLLCRQCESVCPEEVPVAQMVKFVRSSVYRTSREQLPEKIQKTIKNLQQSGNIFGQSGGQATGKFQIVYFRGCTVRWRSPETADHDLYWLKKAGLQAGLIDEVCCGRILDVFGFPSSEQENLIRRNLEMLRKAGADTIITGCPGCFLFFKNSPYFKHSFRILFITEALRNRLPSLSIPEKIFIHDPCLLTRYENLGVLNRMLLKQTGAEITNMDQDPETAPCCGAGGGAGITHKKLVKAMAAQGVQRAFLSKAKIMVTFCPTSRYVFRKFSDLDDFPVMTFSEFLKQSESGNEKR